MYREYPSATDPTGYWAGKTRGVVKMVVGVVLMALGIFTPCADACFWAGFSLFQNGYAEYMSVDNGEKWVYVGGEFGGGSGSSSKSDDEYEGVCRDRGRVAAKLYLL